MSRTRGMVLVAAGALTLLWTGATTRAQCPETNVPSAIGMQMEAEHGFAVAQNGHLLVVGSPDWGPAPGKPEGQVTLAEWNGSAWTPYLLPKPASIQSGDRFGAAVAINHAGDAIVVGAPAHDAGGTDRGLVVIYEYDPGPDAFVITQQWPGIFDFGYFGLSLDLEDDLLLVGEPGALGATGVTNCYRRTGFGTWPNDGLFLGLKPGDAFGWSVSVSGERFAIGAPNVDVGGDADRGIVTVYEYGGSGWAPVQTLRGWAAGSQAGFSIDLHGNSLAIGMPGNGSGQGAAELYRYDGTTWNSFTWVSMASGNPDRGGWSVAVSDTIFAVGTPGAAPGGYGTDTGKVILALLFEDAWFWTDYYYPHLLGDPPQTGAGFGSALSLQDKRLLVGSPFWDAGLDTDVGAAWTYDLHGNVPEFFDEGHALAGYGGQDPQLRGDGMPCTNGISLVGSQVRPYSTSHLVLSLDPLFLPFKGGVMVPDADYIVSPLYTADLGLLFLAGTMPTGLPGYDVWMQLWIEDTDGPMDFAATNGLMFPVPPL